VRDDFLIPVKDTLAKRVGFRCSNPGCRKPTSGPQEDPAKSVNVGVAAHITAAASDGPRYDPALSSDERKSPPNGIWLCQSCAKLVDNDEIRRDLAEHPLFREFVPLKRIWTYCASGNELMYYYEDHSELDNKLRILQNYSLIRDISTDPDNKRYVFTEGFVRYFGG